MIGSSAHSLSQPLRYDQYRRGNYKLDFIWTYDEVNRVKREKKNNDDWNDDELAQRAARLNP